MMDIIGAMVCCKGVRLSMKYVMLMFLNIFIKNFH